jgi:hypothetical protein
LEIAVRDRLYTRCERGQNWGHNSIFSGCNYRPRAQSKCSLGTPRVCNRVLLCSIKAYKTSAYSICNPWTPVQFQGVPRLNEQRTFAYVAEMVLAAGPDDKAVRRTECADLSLRSRELAQQLNAGPVG